jgi:ketosteroid isomerase-like protein
MGYRTLFAAWKASMFRSARVRSFALNDLGRQSRGRRSPLFPLAILFAAIAAPGAAHGQEIPLEQCDTLPVVQVEAAGRQVRFLVDTAATSMLNLDSFTQGQSRDVRVTSWRGTLATNAKEVTIPKLVVGRTTVMGLRMHAIDLSEIGKACGGEIDGILGVDLLEKIGATIDLKRRVLRVATVGDERDAELISEVRADMDQCTKALNDSNADTFADCLDPNVGVLAPNEELHGREQVTAYFRDHYFHRTPAARLEIRESAFHPIDDVIWYEYDFTIESEQGRSHGKGAAICRKSGGRWKIAGVYPLVTESEPAGIAAAGR